MQKTIILLSILFSINIACEDDLSLTKDARENLKGIWYVSEESNSFGQKTYESEIKIDNITEDKILIYNFFELGKGLSANAYLDGNNISIPKQTIDDIEIEGKGELNKDQTAIYFDYNVDLGLGDGVEAVTAHYSQSPVVKLLKPEIAIK